MQASESREASRDRLMHDLDNVVADVEQFVSASAGRAGERYDSAVAKLAVALDNAKTRVEAAQHRIAETTRATTLATDAYVHENAWKMIALAAAGGLLAGLIVSRR